MAKYTKEAIDHDTVAEAVFDQRLMGLGKA